MSRLLKSLPPRHRAFVREYLVDLNATAACQRVGFTPSNCKSTARDLMERPEIRAAIEAGMAQRASTSSVRADLVLERLANLAHYDIADLYTEDGCIRPIDEIPRIVRDAITGVEVVEMFNDDGQRIGVTKKIKISPRIGAIDLLMKHLGLLTAPKNEDDYEDAVGTLLRIMQGHTLRPMPKNRRLPSAANVAPPIVDVTPNKTSTMEICR